MRSPCSISAARWPPERLRRFGFTRRWSVLTSAAESLLAEVSTDHLLVNPNLRRRSGGQRAAEIEHGDLIANVEDQVGMVLDQQDAGTATADRLDQRGQALDLVAGESGGGLVEQQEI